MDQSQSAQLYMQHMLSSPFQTHQDVLSEASLVSSSQIGLMDNNLQRPIASTAASIAHPEVMRHPPNKQFSSWYTHELSPSCMHPAKEAYEKAVNVLKRDISPTDCDNIWLRGKNSMLDVQKALVEAESSYQDRLSKSKIRTVLASCSSRVTYYAPILDTLCQHYPEYTSLVWGAFKFFFTVMINFEELLIELSRAITMIANVLPRTRLLYELYPTEDMQSAVANVYSKIIEFVLETLKWYKKNRLQHALAAVVNPYKLSFKGIVDEIADRSRAVDELANTAVKAELRDVHLKVNTLYHENVSLRSDTFDMKRDLMKLHQQFQLMTQTMIESRSLQSQMMINQQGQSMLMLEWQVDNLRHILESSETIYSSAEVTLAFCRSMRNRRKLRTPTLMPRSEIVRLKDWAEDQRSSILVARAQGIRNSSIDFVTDFLEAGSQSRVPIVWVLPSSFDGRPTLIGILQSLVLQIMNVKGATHFDIVTVQDLKAATTPARWFAILERCLRRLERVFIVIDMSLIEKSTSSVVGELDDWDAYWFLDQVQHLIGKRPKGWVKVILASWTSDRLEQSLADSSTKMIMIRTDRGLAQERRFWGPRHRAVARRNVSLSLRELQQVVGAPLSNQEQNT